EDAVLLESNGQTLRTGEVEGRFPDVNKVLPAQRPRFAVRIDPGLLIDILRVAKDFTEEDARGVYLLFYGQNVPVGVACRNSRGQAFDGLVVPLVTKP